MFDIDLSSSVSGFNIELSPSSTGGRLHVKLSSIFALYPVFIKAGTFSEKQVYIKVGGIFI